MAISSKYQFEGAFSMGYGNKTDIIGRKAAKRLNDGVQTPGPAAYQFNFIPFSSPKWTILGKRKQNIQSSTPPPGYYEIPSTFKKAACQRQFKEPHQQKKHKQQVQPTTQINLKSFTEQKGGFTFGYKLDQISPANANYPGPQKYNLRQMQQQRQKTAFQNKRRKQHYFGKEQRRLHTSEGRPPGPGYYTPNYDYNKSQCGPALTRAIKNRPLLEKDQIGPGIYSPCPIRTDKKFTIQSKRVDHPQRYPTPGPGHYVVDKRISKSAVRMVDPKRKVQRSQPSPFGYDIPRFPDDCKSTQAGFSNFSKRIETKDKNQTPGPGSYDIPSGLSKKYFQIGRKQLKVKTADKRPQVCSYSPSYKLVEYRFSQAFISEPRRRLEDQDDEEEQKVERSKDKEKQFKRKEFPGYSFPKAKRQVQKVQPKGKYQFFSEFNDNTIGLLPSYIKKSIIRKKALALAS